MDGRIDVGTQGGLRFLLQVQVVLFDGLEAVESEVVVRLAEHADLPWLGLLTLNAQHIRIL